MDDFKEMIELEKKFGPVPLGYKTEALPLEPRVSISGGEQSLWTHITSRFKATKRKWNEFLNIIDLAQVEKETVLEQQKKRALDEFLMERNVQRSKEKLHQFV
jgi:protoporphyrinogen oxidase